MVRKLEELKEKKNNELSESECGHGESNPSSYFNFLANL
jgi:hypothetical protein